MHRRSKHLDRLGWQVRQCTAQRELQLPSIPTAIMPPAQDPFHVMLSLRLHTAFLMCVMMYTAVMLIFACIYVRSKSPGTPVP